MLLRILYISLCLGMVLNTVSCDWNQNSDDDGAEPYLIPLTVGNEWIYQDIVYANGVAGEPFTSRLEIPKSSIVGNRIVYHWAWVNVETDPDSVVNWMIYNDGTGVRLAGATSPSDTLYADYAMMAYPAESGREYSTTEIFSYHSSLFARPVTYRVISADTTLVTPNGTLDHCVCYLKDFLVDRETPGIFGIEEMQGADSLRGNYTQRLWYKPGIGYVGLDSVIEGVVIRSKRLLDYHLN